MQVTEVLRIVLIGPVTGDWYIAAVLCPSETGEATPAQLVSLNVPQILVARLLPAASGAPVLRL